MADVFRKETERLVAAEVKKTIPFNLFSAQARNVRVAAIRARKPPVAEVTSRPTKRADRPRGRRTGDGAKSLLGGRKKPRVGLGS